MSDLSDAHKAQVQRLTTHLKAKRERAVSERDGLFNDFKTDRLADESVVFNVADVTALLEAYHSQVKTQFREELEKEANLSAVFAVELFSQAEQANVTLQAEDIANLEDNGRLEQVAALAAAAKGNAPLSKSKPALAAVAGTSGADPAVLQELQELKDEKRMLQDRQQLMQTNVTTLTKERATVQGELDQVKSRLKELMVKNAGAGSGGGNGDTERQLDAKNAECEEMKKELSKRLGDSSQFKQLNAIVQKKSQEIKSLRQQLTAAGVAMPGAEGDGVIELSADSD